MGYRSGCGCGAGVDYGAAEGCVKGVQAWFGEGCCFFLCGCHDDGCFGFVNVAGNFSFRVIYSLTLRGLAWIPVPSINASHV